VISLSRPPYQPPASNTFLSPNQHQPPTIFSYQISTNHQPSARQQYFSHNKSASVMTYMLPHFFQENPEGNNVQTQNMLSEVVEATQTGDTTSDMRVHTSVMNTSRIL
jgi:hypothetical protein